MPVVSCFQNFVPYNKKFKKNKKSFVVSCFQNFVPYNQHNERKQIQPVVSCFQNFVPYNTCLNGYMNNNVVSCFQNFVPYNPRSIRGGQSHCCELLSKLCSLQLTNERANSRDGL